jgi:hypothetical protein
MIGPQTYGDGSSDVKLGWHRSRAVQPRHMLAVAVGLLRGPGRS